jgi:hypothetical protein
VAVVNVAEYAVLATNANGGIQIPLGTPLTTYDVAVGSSATAGPILNLTTKMVRMNTDVSCRVRLDTSNNVTATDARMAANQTEYWGVPGPGFMISVITSP